MKKTTAWIILLTLAVSPTLLATPSWDLEGTYVEARSAQVFIGGCIWNSEAVTIGREAVMAWRIEKGHIGDLDVAGLAVVAAIAGDENLAINPDAARETVLYVDEAASDEQRDALAALYTEQQAHLFGEVVEVVTAPVSFMDTADGYSVSVSDEVELVAEKLHVDHKALSQCGDAQWYEPFVPLDDTTLGMAIEHSYQGQALGARWNDPNKQSAFFGRFGS